MFGVIAWWLVGLVWARVCGFGFDVRWILCFVLVLGIVWLVSVLGCGGSFTVGWLLAVSIGGACWICCWVVLVLVTGGLVGV